LKNLSPKLSSCFLKQTARNVAIIAKTPSGTAVAIAVLPSSLSPPESDVEAAVESVDLRNSSPKGRLPVMLESLAVVLL